MDDLLTKLSIEETPVEEYLPLRENMSARDRISYILAKELPKFQNDFTVNPYLLSSQIFYDDAEYLEGLTREKIDEVSLIRSVLFGAASHFMSLPQEYISKDTDDAVKHISIDIYADFMRGLDFKRISPTIKTDRNSAVAKIERQLPSYMSLKCSRPDIDTIVDVIMPLYHGVEPALDGVGNLASLRQLAAANVIRTSYFNETLEASLKEQLSSGAVSPNSSFVHTLVLYHSSLIESIMGYSRLNNNGVDIGDKNA